MWSGVCGVGLVGVCLYQPERTVRSGSLLRRVNTDYK